MRQWKLACLKGVITTFAQFFLLSVRLGNSPLPQRRTIAYSNALFMTALAVPLLGERVGLTRWTAVLVGFAGVLMIVRPGADTFTADALLPLAAAFPLRNCGRAGTKVLIWKRPPRSSTYMQASPPSSAPRPWLWRWMGFSTLHIGAGMLWIIAMGL